MIETLEDEDAPVRTYVDLVKYIENTLGWTWPWEDTRPPWKIRAIEAGKIKKVAGKRKLKVPDLVTTVDWMRKERITVESPVGVVYFAERALREVAKLHEAESWEDEVAKTIAEVSASGLPESEKTEWTKRLHRVKGDVALETVKEWRER